MTSKLDFNNGLLTGIPRHLTNKLQTIQNAAARLIMRSKRQEHITPMLYELHWLPIIHRIRYKVMVLVYKTVEGTGPKYLEEILHLYTPNRTLRSSLDPLTFTVPKTRLKSYGDCAFSTFAPREWNSLPLSIRSSESLPSFKSSLKTYYFKKHFGDIAQ